MNYWILIIVGVLGIVLGAHFARKMERGVVSGQSRRKRTKKEKILEYLRKNERVTNNEVEKLLDVSDATATRYLDDLEKKGKVQQVGTTGNAVYYTLT
jgi:predicted HTH transcriptional regulator